MQVFKSLDNLPQFKNAVVTIGTFDGVHLGHQKLLERINELAKKNDGESILITFHPHPRFVVQPDSDLKLLNTIDEKIDLLKKYKVNNVVVAPFSKEFSNMPAISYVKDFLVENFKPHTLVIGYDHHFGKNRSGNIDLLEEYKDIFGYNVEQISKETIQDIGISSTKIREALAQGKVQTANKLLGHEYSINGFVTKGEQLGRKIGFPTANVQLLVDYKLIPKNGVYIVNVKVKNSLYKGMLNIGVRPTIEGLNKTIEVNIFDFDQDIYGEKIEVILLKYIREEQKFESLEALKQQLNKDKAEALAYFQ
ncbi:MAG: bifunctional riboflavin kinase/FAD synthetase [Bacteroidetes bacterium]|nr:bifunctional riboflavin kinase/FAD synthetase [Bacteroidota bacterium]MCB9226750.1 bifunctional riboflavin kinase/FAD synthetase [Chitinophagales bacterium]